MEHTPGPWEFHEWPDMAGVVIFPQPAPRGYSADITFYFENEDGWTREQCIANAALIAAAPDLLAALEALVAEGEADYDGRYYGMVRDEIHDRAVAAIVKAKGLPAPTR